MHKFCCLIDSWFVNDNRNFTLKLTSNISTPELWLWIHTFDNSYFVVLFYQAKPKAKEFKNKPIPNYDKLVELYGKDIETGKQIKIVVKCSWDFFFFVFWISGSFVFPCSI